MATYSSVLLVPNGSQPYRHETQEDQLDAQFFDLELLLDLYVDDQEPQPSRLLASLSRADLRSHCCGRYRLRLELSFFSYLLGPEADANLRV